VDLTHFWNLAIPWAFMARFGSFLEFGHILAIYGQIWVIFEIYPYIGHLWPDLVLF
jgi:hypothetical protein